MENQNLESVKKQLIETINKKLEDKIIEQSNADLIVKLINRAETVKEAVDIAALGTTYKKTGFHFDKRLDKIVNNGRIKYFKKNNELSFNDGSDNPVNKLIIGDNFDALQNLLIQYKGSIDVIYIDPPYGKDSMGQFAETNYNNALTRDNLLSMLYPRLVLAKELLSDDGVIFCSIDDRNQAYVKCLFDEVFEEQNSITTFHWEKTQHFGRQKINYYSNCEYILCYSKKLRDQGIKEMLVEKLNKNLTDAPLYNASNNEKELIFPIGSVLFNLKDGVYQSSNSNDYILLEPVEVKNKKNANELKMKFKSRWAQSTIEEEYNKGTSFWVKSNKFAIRTIYGDDKSSNIAPKSLIFTNENNPLVAMNRFGERVGTNENASKEIEMIFNNKVFDYSKPVSLIKYLVSLFYDEGVESYKDDIVVLDFFAGSGTTGQAVSEMNHIDGGKRQFVLVQLPENLDEELLSNPNNETLLNQIKLCDTINRPHVLSEICVERLRRTMLGKSIKKSEEFKWLEKNEPLGGSLDVYEIDSVANNESTEGRTAFDVIDETLYGKEKFTNLQDKIDWVCSNFENCQRELKE